MVIQSLPTLCLVHYIEAFKYSGVKVKNHKLSADEVYLWARSTELINRSLSRFGTTDSSEYHHKYLHSQKQGRTGRAMSTRKTQSSRGSESKIGRQFTKKGTIREVKNLKVLFESIDQDSTGVVAVDYLRKPKRQSANFQLRVVSCLFQEVSRVYGPFGRTSVEIWS